MHKDYIKLSVKKEVINHTTHTIIIAHSWPMASKNHSPTIKKEKREVFGLPNNEKNNVYCYAYALSPAINPLPRIAVMIITVSKINTTIAVITIKIGNQSVTVPMELDVSFITSVAVLLAS